jgi:hypothetical protein
MNPYLAKLHSLNFAKPGPRATEGVVFRKMISTQATSRMVALIQNIVPLNQLI